MAFAIAAAAESEAAAWEEASVEPLLLLSADASA